MQAARPAGAGLTRLTEAEQEALEAYQRLGSVRAVARELGRHPASIRERLHAAARKQSLDPNALEQLTRAGVSDLSKLHSAWVKTQPDASGGSASAYLYFGKETASEREDMLERVKEAFIDIPPVALPVTRCKAVPNLLALMPLNDLHAGLYAWGKETGYADYDLKIATTRLTDWVGRLVDRSPTCEECILFYNGDTLHANGTLPMTPASKHLLDTDSRHFKVVDAVSAAIVTTVDIAAQKHKHVRLVIKRGNHDEDSYIALLMAAKYRYAEQANVTVEEDPSPYWTYRYGNVLLAGHHGDRVKPEALVMKLASDHAELWGATTRRYIWTGHLHSKASGTLYGAMWERASCITSPDAYGANWGDHAMAQVIIYHRETGEHERYTVRP